MSWLYELKKSMGRSSVRSVSTARGRFQGDSTPGEVEDWCHVSSVSNRVEQFPKSDDGRVRRELSKAPRAELTLLTGEYGSKFELINKLIAEMKTKGLEVLPEDRGFIWRCLVAEAQEEVFRRLQEYERIWLEEMEKIDAPNEVFRMNKGRHAANLWLRTHDRRGTTK